MVERPCKQCLEEKKKCLLAGAEHCDAVSPDNLSCRYSVDSNVGNRIAGVY